MDEMVKLALGLVSEMPKVRVTATCNSCREVWDAVQIIPPPFAMQFLGARPEEDPIDFLRKRYMQGFGANHSHSMAVLVEEVPANTALKTPERIR